MKHLKSYNTPVKSALGCVPSHPAVFNSATPRTVARQIPLPMEFSSTLYSYSGVIQVQELESHSLQEQPSDSSICHGFHCLCGKELGGNYNYLFYGYTLLKVDMWN